MDRDAALTRKLYDRYAIQYSLARSKSRVGDVLQRKLMGLMGNMHGKRIFFAGCGDGRECVQAVKAGAIVYGMDISSSQIELARKNCPKANFTIGDFSKTNFKAQSFDYIFSYVSIMYKKDLTKPLLEFKRILKNNGAIILTVPHPIRKMMKYNKGNYFVRGRRFETWRGARRFNYYWLFGDYIDAFVASSLKLVKLIEPKPIKENSKTPDSEVSYPHNLVFELVKGK